MPLILPAPAKLNLFLHILGKRKDGYHDLQTVFQLLDFGDQLSFKRREDKALNLVTTVPELDSADNLIYRAARLLQDHCEVSQGVDIGLEKRLPMGGGLGGGSSDAATTLLALNTLWHCRLSLDQLARLGQPLGADIPVFIRGRSAWAEGVGERLQALDLPEVYYLVVTPNCHISTAQIFAHSELTRDSAAITVAAFLKQGGHNDCQSLVEKLYPEVNAVVEWLKKANPNSQALMTGTGASVFTTFDSESAAQRHLDQCPWPGFIAKGINQSPVHERLAKL